MATHHGVGHLRYVSAAENYTEQYFDAATKIAYPYTTFCNDDGFYGNQRYEELQRRLHYTLYMYCMLK